MTTLSDVASLPTPAVIEALSFETIFSSHNIEHLYPHEVPVAVNQQFRKDYWVKGARRLTPLEQAERLRAQRVVLGTPAADVPLKVNGAMGEATLAEAVYQPILKLMADHQPRTLAQMEQAVQPAGINFAQVVQAALVLAGAGHLLPVQDDAAAKGARAACQRINPHLMNKARGQADLSFLASPLTGGGVAVGRFAQLFLLARQAGHKQPADWAGYTWSLLAARGQRILKDGKALETAEDNLAELTAQAQVFADKQLPVLKALQVV